MLRYSELPKYGKFIINDDSSVRAEPQTDDKNDDEVRGRSIEMLDTSPLKAFDAEYKNPTVFYSLKKIRKPKDTDLELDGIFMTHVMPCGGDPKVNGVALYYLSKSLKKMPDLHIIYTSGTKLPKDAMIKLGFKLIGSGSGHNVFAYQPKTLENRLLLSDNLLWDGFRQTDSMFYKFCEPI